MSIGERLIALRKSKNLSQEQVADKINVTRQTISKWETDQSMPDLDKVVPLCELYGITADELLSGKVSSDETLNLDKNNSEREMRKNRSLGIGIGILLYFVSIAWIMISIPVVMMNPIVASAVFLLICGVATFVIVFSCINYKVEKKEEKVNKVAKSIKEIIAILTCIIYFVISFLTLAWHITWIIWVAYGLIEAIVDLIFQLKESKNEE